MTELLQPIPDMIPIDVILDILILLPLKSLLRFKSVSKNWYYLISSPDFAKLHYSHHHNNSNRCDSSKQQLLIIGEDLKCYMSYMPELNEANQVLCLRTDFMDGHNCDECKGFQFQVGHLNIFPMIGSANGLICLFFFYGKLVLFNPSTRTHTFVPCPSIVDLLKEPACYGFSMGFGYDHLCYDYRVVTIVWQSLRGVNHVTRTMVYSLNSNSWRTAPSLMSDSNTTFSWHNLVFVNDVLHTISWEKEPQFMQSDYRSLDIICFDIHHERWSELPAPPHHGGRQVQLSVLDDCLCVAVEVLNGFDLWVMKEYGIKESWIIFLSIVDFNDYSRSMNYELPICINNHETWFLTRWTEFFGYNSRVKSHDSWNKSFDNVFTQLRPLDATLVRRNPVKLSMKSEGSIISKLPIPRQRQMLP